MDHEKIEAESDAFTAEDMREIEALRGDFGLDWHDAEQLYLVATNKNVDRCSRATAWYLHDVLEEAIG